MPGVDVLASVFNGANAAFIADLYAKWVSDPASVDPSFAELFAEMGDEARGVLMDASGASWAPHRFDVSASRRRRKAPAKAGAGARRRSRSAPPRATACAR